jgi:DNA-binding transcriptional ArsR family regulator
VSQARSVALRRVLRLHAALATPRSLYDLSDVLNVSQRTVRRDLDVLRGAGAIIWRNETSGRWTMTRGLMVEPAPMRNAEAGAVEKASLVGA